MPIIKMNDLELAKKRVFIRSDLNVPIKDGKIISDIRIRSSLPTIELALKQDARVIVASHLGRPKEGEYNEEFSLLPIVNYLKNKLPVPVHFVKDYLDGIEVMSGELAILENVRFNKGEKNNDDILSKKYAALCDIFVMDAFGVAHRIQASTYGISKFANISCAGQLLITEINALSKVLRKPARPMVAIVGGSKISTKLTILNSLSKIADTLICGGGIANTFIASQGYTVGKSLYEAALLDKAKYLLLNTRHLLIPDDVYVTNELSKFSSIRLRSINDIKNNEYIVDIGDKFITKLDKVLRNARTILWNGPVGIFEFPNFRNGTEIIANIIASNDKAFTIAGGGDTLAVIDMLDIYDKISYISTGGGSFLKFIESGMLPTVEILKERAKIK